MAAEGRAPRAPHSKYGTVYSPISVHIQSSITSLAAASASGQRRGSKSMLRACQCAVVYSRKTVANALNIPKRATRRHTVVQRHTTPATNCAVNVHSPPLAHLQGGPKALSNQVFVITASDIARFSKFSPAHSTVNLQVSAA